MWGKSIGVNLFDYKDLTSLKSISTTYALGNIQIMLMSPNAKTVRLFSDIYDWDYHDKSYKESKWTPPSSKRDRLIWAERKRAGLNDSHGFNVIMYGLGTLR